MLSAVGLIAEDPIGHNRLIQGNECEFVLSRRAAREVALRSLFQMDVGRTDVEGALSYNLQILPLSEKAVFFARQLVEGTVAHLEDIDETIRRSALRWSVDRMARTDRNILRLAIFELLYHSEAPAKVIVNEAVELAKSYGDDDSGKFVNGILGQVLRSTSAT